MSSRNGPRNFVLTITGTPITTEELAKALSRVAGSLQTGRSPIEQGTVRNSEGKIIGNYRWVTRPPKPEDFEGSGMDAQALRDNGIRGLHAPACQGH